MRDHTRPRSPPGCARRHRPPRPCGRRRGGCRVAPGPRRASCEPSRSGAKVHCTRAFGTPASAQVSTSDSTRARSGSVSTDGSCAPRRSSERNGPSRWRPVRLARGDERCERGDLADERVRRGRDERPDEPRDARVAVVGRGRGRAGSVATELVPERAVAVQVDERQVGGVGHTHTLGRGPKADAVTRRDRPANREWLTPRNRRPCRGGRAGRSRPDPTACR